MKSQSEIFNDIYKISDEEADSFTNVKFILENLKLESPILEIGFGKGFVLNYLNSICKGVTGIEISQEAINYVKNNFPEINVLTYDGIKLPFNDCYFKTVFSFDVLEHCHNVNLHLAEVWRVLKKGGVYAFQTPNIITNLPKEIIYRGSLKKAREFHPSVQSFFSLKNILVKNNFKYTFVNMKLISPEKSNEISRNSKILKIGAFILKKIPSGLIPYLFRPNFWVIAQKI